MTGKLLLIVFGVALALGAPGARAARIFVAPLPDDDATATALTRAVESAVLQKIADADVVTPRALDTKLELDLVNACQTGDDTSCVVDFAQSMGVEYVLRSQRTHLGDSTILTLSLYDGARAALVGQGQRMVGAGQDQALLEQVPELVAEVARAAGLAVKVDKPKPFPWLAASALGSGALLLLGSGAVHGFGFLVAEPAYQRAELTRDQAALWEGTRPAVLGAPFVGYLVGVGLVGVGIWSLTAESP